MNLGSNIKPHEVEELAEFGYQLAVEIKRENVIKYNLYFHPG